MRGKPNRVQYQAFILRELKELHKEPLPNIWVRPVGDSVDHLHALILGPSDTPYAGGFFVFDFTFPSTYPFDPPCVQLLTTNNHRVRFNPNLYACGRVCLSILGTWAGPVWTSAEGIGSVLLSIQSLLNSKPYHNEPGFEDERSPNAVQNYNDRVLHETLRVAVVGQLEGCAQPAGSQVFRDIFEAQFPLWFDHYLHTAQSHLHMQGKPFQDPFESAPTGQFDYSSLVSRLQAIHAALRHNHRPPDHNTPCGVGTDLNSVVCARGFSSASELIAREAKRLDEASLSGVSAAPREDNLYVWDVFLLAVKAVLSQRAARQVTTPRWQKTKRGRHLFRLHPDPTRRAPAALFDPALPRRTQVVLERIRLGNASDNDRLARAHGYEYGTCTRCGESTDSAEHRIFSCPAYAAARRRLKSALKRHSPEDEELPLHLNSLVGLLDIPTGFHKAIVAAFVRFLQQTKLIHLFLWNPKKLYQAPGTTMRAQRPPHV